MLFSVRKLSAVKRYVSILNTLTVKRVIFMKTKRTSFVVLLFYAIKRLCLSVDHSVTTECENSEYILRCICTLLYCSLRIMYPVLITTTVIQRTEIPDCHRLSMVLRTFQVKHMKLVPMWLSTVALRFKLKYLEVLTWMQNFIEAYHFITRKQIPCLIYVKTSRQSERSMSKYAPTVGLF